MQFLVDEWSHWATQVEQLKTFNLGGYWFDETLSSENELVFKREEIA